MVDLIQFTLREGLILLAGAFIGWNVPRPEWAKNLQAWVVAQYNKLAAKVKAKFSK